jgi:hypothetical protein
MATQVTPSAYKALLLESGKNRQDIFKEEYDLFAELDAANDSVEIVAKGEERTALSFDFIVEENRLKDAVKENIGTTLSPSYADQEVMSGIVLRNALDYLGSGVLSHDNGVANGLTAKGVKQIPEAIAQNNQKDMAAILKGGFAAATATPYIVDLTGESGNAQILTPDKIQEIKGTKYPTLDDDVSSKLIGNSNVVNNLFKQLDSQNAANEYDATGNIPTIRGYMPIKNNTIGRKDVVEAGVDEIYWTYLTFDQPFYVSEEASMWLEMERQATKDGGQWTQIVRWYDALGVWGLSWIGSKIVTPSRTALETGTNWKWIFKSAESTPIIAIKSRLVPYTAS